MPALAQNATVTANLKLLSGGASQPTGTSIRVDLQNCAAPRVPGTGNVGEKSRTFYPSTFGVAFITLWSNGVLDCGAGVPVNPSQAPSFYTFNLVSNGGVTSLGSYKVPAGTSTLDTLTPINSVPVIPTPSGDNSYLRLDLSNFSNLVQPLPNLDVKLDNSVVIAGEYASLNAASASCPLVGGCTIEVNTTVPLSANLTLPSTTTLKFNQPGKITLGGLTLTTANVVAAPYQIFSGIVTLGPQVSQPWVEWFGAVGDWNGSTGTDNTTAIQACITSLQSGQCVFQASLYAISNVINITKSNVGFRGQNVVVHSPTQYLSSGLHPSGMITTSTTANLINVHGTDLSHNIAFNQFNYFNLQRAATPTTTTSHAMDFNFTYGVTVDHVVSEDSPGGFFMHATGSQGTGGFSNDFVTWGDNGFAATSGSYCGFCLDSADGASNPSLRIRNVAVSSNLGAGVTTFGLSSTGLALNDLHVYNFESALLSYGIYLNGGATSALDIHITDPVNDGCIISCIYVTDSNGGAGAIEISGGWSNRAGTNSSPVIDLEGANNVTIADHDILAPTAGPAIFVNGGSFDTIHHVTFVGGSNPAVSSVGTSFLTITGNQMRNINAGAGIGVIQLAGVQHGEVSENNISGTGGSGIHLDASTVGIAGIPANAVSGTFTAATIDLGINPTTPLFFSIGNTGSVYQNRQQIRQTTSLCTASASGTCSFTLTWSAAFPDASWKGACTVETASGSGVITQIAAAGKTTTTATVSFRDFSAASNTLSSVVCEGWE